MEEQFLDQNPPEIQDISDDDDENEDIHPQDIRVPAPSYCRQPSSTGQKRNLLTADGHVFSNRLHLCSGNNFQCTSYLCPAQLVHQVPFGQKCKIWAVKGRHRLDCQAKQPDKLFLSTFLFYENLGTLIKDDKGYEYGKHSGKKIIQWECTFPGCNIIVRTSNFSTLEILSNRAVDRTFPHSFLHDHTAPYFPKDMAPQPKVQNGAQIYKQTAERETLTVAPITVSAPGAKTIQSTLMDDQHFLYHLHSTKGDTTRYTCNANSICTGGLTKVASSSGIEVWTRKIHLPRGNHTAEGDVEQFDCRPEGQSIWFPLTQGVMKYLKKKNGYKCNSIVIYSVDGQRYRLGSQRQNFSYFQCYQSTCPAGLRLLKHGESSSWEMKMTRISDGAKFSPTAHSQLCKDDVALAEYEIYLEQNLSSNPIVQPNVFNVGEAKKCLVIDEDDAELEVHELIALSQRIKTKRQFDENHEDANGDDNNSQNEYFAQNGLEFEILLCSPPLQSVVQQQEDPKAQFQIKSLKDAIRHVNEYTKANQGSTRAEKWQPFIKECLQLNKLRILLAAARATEKVKSSQIPGFEQTIGWHTELNTLHFRLDSSPLTSLYKCSILDCDKFMISKTVNTCLQHANKSVFSIMVLRDQQTPPNYYTSCVTRPLSNFNPIDLSDAQVLQLARNKSIISTTEGYVVDLFLSFDLSGDEENFKRQLTAGHNLYSAIQATMFLQSSLHSDQINLKRHQLDMKSVGQNFKNVLKRNGFWYSILDKKKYIIHQMTKGLSKEEAGSKYNKIVQQSRIDIHDTTCGPLPPLARLCFKKLETCPKWPLVYWVRGWHRNAYYFGLNLLARTGESVVAACHRYPEFDPTTLGKHYIKHDLQLDTRDKDQCGVAFAKPTDRQAAKGESLTIFASLLMASAFTEHEKINRYMPCDQKFSQDDLLDLQCFMAAQFGVILYMKMESGDRCQKVISVGDPQVV